MRNLILICGLPGAGKSSYGQKLIEEATSLGKTNAHFEADQFMLDQDNKYSFNKAKLGFVHKMCQLSAEKAMIDGKETVVVSNTFTTRKERKTYLEMAASQGYNVIIVNLFDAGLSDMELHERNVHGVPVETIKRMRERWEEPTRAEGFLIDIYG